MNKLFMLGAILGIGFGIFKLFNKNGNKTPVMPQDAAAQA